jgi:hypothetical protein
MAFEGRYTGVRNRAHGFDKLSRRLNAGGVARLAVGAEPKIAPRRRSVLVRDLYTPPIASLISRSPLAHVMALTERAARLRRPRRIGQNIPNGVAAH